MKRKLNRVEKGESLETELTNLTLRQLFGIIDPNKLGKLNNINKIKQDILAKNSTINANSKLKQMLLKAIDRGTQE